MDRIVAFGPEVEARRNRRRAGHGNLLWPRNDGNRGRYLLGNDKAHRALEQRRVATGGFGGCRLDAHRSAISQHHIGGVGAIAPVAQRIGQAPRRNRPGCAGRQHEGGRRRKQRVVGQPLKQDATFDLAARVDAGRAIDPQLELGQRLGAEIGQLDPVDQCFPITGGCESGCKLEAWCRHDGIPELEVKKRLSRPAAGRRPGHD